MTTEAKVGAFTIVGLALLAAVVIMLSGYKIGGNKGYTVYAGFSQVIGVDPQSAVRLAGVPVGTVKSIDNDGSGVTVTLAINKGVKIPKGSAVSIGSTGVMGDKFINIQPAANSDGWVENGDYLIGQDEMGMDQLFASMGQVVTQVQGLLDGMNKIVGNADFQQSIVQMAINMRDATAHISGMMAAFENMAQSNQGNVNEMLTNLNNMTASLDRSANAVEAMMTNLATVGADPQTAENLRLTLDNITESSDRIRVITEGLAQVAGDQKTIDNTKAIIQNTKNLTDKANNLKNKLSNIKVSGDADVLYSGASRDDDKDWLANFNVNVGNPDDVSLIMGLDAIGNGDRGNFEVAKRLSSGFGARGGVIYGQPGVGVDAYAGENFKISADAYDMNDPALRLRAQYRLGDSDTWLMGQWNDVNDSDHRTAYVGLRQSF